MKRAIFATLAMSLLIAACGGDGDGGATTSSEGGTEDQANNTIDITMQDYAFAVEGEPTAGDLTLMFHNEGDDLHHGIVGQLTGGKTIEDVQKFLEGPQGPPPSWFNDSPLDMTLVSPGESSGVTIDAREGTYVLLCFMPGPENKPHFAHGMVETFDVAAGDVAEPPEPDATVSMSEAGIGSPDGLSAGTSVIEVTNDSEIEMEAFVISLEEGKTIDDIDPWFNKGQKGTPPATFHGGTHTFPAGESALLTFDLEPGEYQLVATYEGKKGPEDIPTDFTVGE